MFSELALAETYGRYVWGLFIVFFAGSVRKHVHICTHRFICTCTFQFGFVEFTKNNARFSFWKALKNNKQISVFGCLVDLSLWNYSQRFGSLKNTKKQMYVYKHICSMFLFSGTWRNCVFLMFALGIVHNKNRIQTQLQQVLLLLQHRGPRTQSPVIF